MAERPAGTALRLGELLARGADRLAAAGVEAPRADARYLAEAALGLDRAGLLSGRDRAVSRGQAAAFEALVARRCRREPVSRILGLREFWSLPIGLDAAVLDPRPDSETLVEVALARLGERPGAARFLDLGCGSGCLLLALLSERPGAWGLGLDRSASLIMSAQGINGLNRDYLINTVRHLEADGHRDGRLHRLLRRVEEMTGLIDIRA